VVALTIDWEGADLATEAFAALDDLRRNLDGVPLTHFVSAAYFTDPALESAAVASIRAAVRADDELAVHAHLWRSLVEAAGVTPKLSPSFLTGTPELVEFEHDDVGFDTDPDAYTVSELRAVLRLSRQLLARTRLPVSQSFRAAGYLATPKLLDALGSEGFTVDSSAYDHRQLEEVPYPFWRQRMAELWPSIDATAQPSIAADRGGDLLEMPIAGVADYATAAQMTALLAGAHERLRKAPGRDVFVVLAFHLETAPDYAAQVVIAVNSVRSNPKISGDFVFTRLDAAAELARTGMSP
jgi:hypothetical protein